MKKFHNIAGVSYPIIQGRREGNEITFVNNSDVIPKCYLNPLTQRYKVIGVNDTIVVVVKNQNVLKRYHDYGSE